VIRKLIRVLVSQLLIFVRKGSQGLVGHETVCPEEADLIHEFVAFISSHTSSDTFDEQHSVKELVDDARAQLRARKPGLTREQFRLEVRRQFGNIDLGLLRRELLAA
jgi:hypothetical protein